MKKIFCSIIIGSCLLNLNSCILIAGSSYAVDQEATYSKNFDYSVAQVSQAVLDLFKKNKNITITKKIITTEKSVIDGTVNSKKYKGSFTVSVVALTNISSTLEIKYDIFGDEVKSKELLEKINKDLEEKYKNSTN
ncbi:DUF3568 family protein [Francisella sp. Scap27]|uniref:DUF3568 family protein n=1 Tax=Francisella sp. Scap27 TaxID=2589986 RepID=UPI0015BB02C0|nr:DUF3568 family protein [Francisella sp. Scap27]QLE78502.1 DUF3568 family protein [Francisella sp. Scap27]